MITCHPNDLRCFVEEGLELIVRARVKDVDVDEALDALWEILVNIDYLVGVREDTESPSARACPATAYLN